MTKTEMTETITFGKTAAHFDEMTWPRAGEWLQELNHKLRYGKPERGDILCAAEICSAYFALVRNKTQEQRNRICSRLQQIEVEN